jgi:hypothetical protein
MTFSIGPFVMICFSDFIHGFLADALFIHPPNVSSRLNFLICPQHAFWQAPGQCTRHGAHVVTDLTCGIHAPSYRLIEGLPVLGFKAEEAHGWHARAPHMIVEIRRPLARERETPNARSYACSNRS